MTNVSTIFKDDFHEVTLFGTFSVVSSFAEAICAIKKHCGFLNILSNHSCRERGEQKEFSNESLSHVMERHQIKHEDDGSFYIYNKDETRIPVSIADVDNSTCYSKKITWTDNGCLYTTIIVKKDFDENILINNLI